MRSYQEYSNERYTLEIHINPQETTVKLFDRDDEILSLNYLTSTPIVADCVNHLIKTITNDVYEYQKDN